eukprot:CAMPEP_0113307618 /NCGR_PEP_ID=MMETSP0010_2-20120614/6394_1 /TAXON_ID=216773 ORGANISM="Corethron hystrix, Strain 308" /NCGR_SAMPLE_ID=MMETSP0010_2 /ASSEMBLY_ACC=CAM_ASM_000155 /LENGTH=404 /DNA_ID=CAMNT_0000162515 /DNA_START=126 /DNA_END=1340 /DNA_ORIENTATION=+ /assembly_acc=CAM_ASM_000155
MPVTTWQDYKAAARRHHDSGNYEASLNAYLFALELCPESLPLERQVILSNIVALRLLIGGEDNNRLAVGDARECINLNPRWAKGHVRMASAYIALGGHSNDACNSLQRSLALDPSNSIARRMLTRELRREEPRRRASLNTATEDSNFRPEPSAPPVDEETYRRYWGASPYEADQTRREAGRPTAGTDTDDGSTFLERARFNLSKIEQWYSALPDFGKNLIKILLTLVILYVAFGGRFGFDSVLDGKRGSSARTAGYYGEHNPYDEYYSRKNIKNDYHRSHGRGSNYDPNYKTRSNYDPNYKTNYGYSQQHRGYDRNRYAYSSPSYFSSTSLWQTLFFVAGAVYVCNKMGLSVFEALYLMNFGLGRGRRGFYRGWGDRFRRGGLRQGGGGMYFNRAFGRQRQQFR